MKREDERCNECGGLLARKGGAVACPRCYAAEGHTHPQAEQTDIAAVCERTAYIATGLKRYIELGIPFYPRHTDEADLRALCDAVGKQRAQRLTVMRATQEFCDTVYDEFDTGQLDGKGGGESNPGESDGGPTELPGRCYSDEASISLPGSTPAAPTDPACGCDTHQECDEHPDPDPGDTKRKTSCDEDSTDAGLVGELLCYCEYETLGRCDQHDCVPCRAAARIEELTRERNDALRVCVEGRCCDSKRELRELRDEIALLAHKLNPIRCSFKEDIMKQGRIVDRLRALASKGGK